MEQFSVMEKTDNSLIDAHLVGDKTAFTEIVRRYGDSVLGYLTKITLDSSQAEDLFQETFRLVHEKARTFRGGNFKSWLFTIATNTAINSMRRKKLRTAVSLNHEFSCGDGDCERLGDTIMSDSPDPSKQAYNEELKRKVRKAVDQLPERQKVTLILAYYQQLSYSEVAMVLNCSVGTVKTQMFRALEALAQRLPDVSEVLE